MDTKDQIIEIFEREAKIKVDTMDLSMDMVDQLGLDSLTRVRIVVAIERKFDITISEEEMMSLKSIKQLQDLLELKISKK